MVTAETTTAAATTATSPARGAAALLARAPFALFLASVASLPFMQPFSMKVFGSAVQPADALFALTGLVWVLSLAAGGKVRRGRFYAVIGLFFGAMLVTTAVGPRSLSRLVIEVYLLGLGVLAYNLVQGLDDLRRTWAVWTGTALFTAACILVSVVLFYAAGIKDQKANPVLWTGGSLPVGNYPRVKGFFLNGNMTGNHLAVSACFAVGLAALSSRHRRWALPAALAIAVASLFTLSTALAGLAIAVAMFAWQWQKSAQKARYLKALAPLAGLFALVMMFVTAFYPKRLPEGVVLEPSPRWLTWTSSWKTFLSRPVFGNGLGVPLADVHWDAPRGVHEHLTDPHNAWLSVAGQTGVLGLAAFVALLVWLGRGLRGMSIAGEPSKIARSALAGALVVAVYQAFSCSLEDMRHLWILFGLIAGVIEAREGDPLPAGRPPR